MRHYHRSQPQTQRTWDEWVEGSPTKVRHSRNWLKIIGIIAGVLALAGIIAGLVIVVVVLVANTVSLIAASLTF